MNKSALDQYRRNAWLFAQARERLGKTMRTVARETGVSHSTIHRFERALEIEATAYVALVLWAVKSNPNIT